MTVVVRSSMALPTLATISYGHGFELNTLGRSLRHTFSRVFPPAQGTWRYFL